jgi:hypothetical protein
MCNDVLFSCHKLFLSYVAVALCSRYVLLYGHPVIVSSQDRIFSAYCLIWVVQLQILFVYPSCLPDPRDVQLEMLHCICFLSDLFTNVTH